MSEKKSKVLVLGSLAFDYIMGFEENFCNAVAIDHEKGDYQSTVTANSRVKYFGGTAGNIAYNLGLLKIVEVALVGAVGPDFDQLGYREHIERFENIKLGVDVYDELFTAACYIVNDVKSNQMIIFHGGALDRCKDIDLKTKLRDPSEFLYAINSTQSVDAMVCFGEQLDELNIPMIFDPGQVTPLFGKDLLIEMIKKTYILIGNKYEINQILKKAELSEEELIHIVHAIIQTRGKEGSQLIYKDENDKVYKVEIPIAKPENEIKDTTGAGDGYRAGLITGLILKMTLLDACRLGSVIGSFVIETSGAQSQTYTLTDVRKRYLNAYGYVPSELEKI
ncbi:MAG: PfkB family carbohydrate kinase [Promethearchaeota archaeon]